MALKGPNWIKVFLALQHIPFESLDIHCRPQTPISLNMDAIFDKVRSL
jgi:hypothetical protein